MTPTSTDARVRTLPYVEHATGPLLLDLYLPAATTAAPVVLWLHGGGWFTGDRTLAPDLWTHFASRGIAMAAIDYRLSGVARFPAQLDDVHSAIRFLRSNAGELGLDGERIGLWGASAGGHLAALAGVTGPLAGCPVQAVAESYAPVDLVGDDVSAGTPLPGADPRTSPEARLLGGLASERPDVARAASPHLHVTRDAPPFHISHGTGDVLVPHQHSLALFDALLAAGVPAELYLIDGYRHGFLNPAGRLDVAMAKVMDDGRLAAEEPVAATARSSNDPDQVRDARFGFDTVGRFFERHLTTPDDTTAPTQENA